MYPYTFEIYIVDSLQYKVRIHLEGLDEEQIKERLDRFLLNTGARYILVQQKIQ